MMYKLSVMEYIAFGKTISDISIIITTMCKIFFASKTTRRIITFVVRTIRSNAITNPSFFFKINRNREVTHYAV